MDHRGLDFPLFLDDIVVSGVRWGCRIEKSENKPLIMGKDTHYGENTGITNSNSI